KTNRDALLLIAFRLFLKNGYEQTRMQDLVAASGLSKGAFHHYFPRKADLLDACIAHFFGRFLPNMDPSAHQHFEDLVLDGARHYAQLIEELTSLGIPLPAYQRFVWSLLPEHSEAFIERQRAIADRLTHLAEQDLAERRLVSTNTARTLAEQAMALTEGLGVLWAATPPENTSSPQPFFEHNCKAWLNDLS
ncbi:MAG: TetR/AcrR family transcriptional regulator, partial [Oceanisphaera sp.]|nr:TetR/AcrR family transcriptional regulator [Oceanisphaera sp.]